VTPAISVKVLVGLDDHHSVRTLGLVTTSSVSYGVTHGARYVVLISIKMKFVRPTVNVQVVICLLNHVTIWVASFANREPYGARVSVGKGKEVKAVRPSGPVIGSV